MSDYDYLNARLKGMSRDFLGRDLFEELLAADNERALVDVLMSSPYGAELHAELAERKGMGAVDAALRRTIAAKVQQVRLLAPERPRRLLDVLLTRWDVANIVAIVRGKSSGASREEILGALLPIGVLREPQLTELVAESDVLAVADTLTTWSWEFARHAKRAIRDHALPFDLWALELAMYDAYFAWASSMLDSAEPNVRLARSVLERHLDLANVLAALRAVRGREQGLALASVAPIRGGSLAARRITAIAEARSLEDAFDLLDRTWFARGVERGILAYGQTRRLGVMERFLEALVVEEAARLYRDDPLGFGVTAGFLYRTVNELFNVRILLRGKTYGVPPNAIREELVLA